MILSPDPQAGRPSLMMIEGGLTLIVAAVAFGWPKLGDGFFSRIERASARLARRKGLTVVVVVLAALLLRLAILPVCPIPHPFVPDDFSFLLAANTFASGRLTNPTPAMWTHFESIHIDMQPTYMSMYFPAQGLVMAAGKVLFGHPWYGLLIMSALMCAAITWMLQAWLPPNWALLGGVIAVLRIGLFSYWINTYTGAGSICALGGALLLGGLPRFLKHPRLRYGLLMATGIVLLGLTRPYEGLLLCLPVLLYLGYSLWSGKTPIAPAVRLRLAVAPLLLIVAAGAWMGYYNYRVFGNPATLPYAVNRASYAMAPYFVWQSPRPEPVYRHASMRLFYFQNELTEFEKIRAGFVYHTFIKVLGGLLFFCGFVLLPPLLMFRRVVLDRRTRFLVICLVVMVTGFMIQIFFIAHYAAPFLAVFYALGLQGMRHLRVWQMDGRPVGLGSVRLTVLLCLALAAVRLTAGPFGLNNPEWPPSRWSNNWYGPGDFGEGRSQVLDSLEKLPGKQLAIVRYSPDHYPLDEWVYNAPDIGNSKVIWAREMDAANNRSLVRYYQDRHVWLVQPDKPSVKVSPYPVSDPDQKTAAAAGVVESASRSSASGPPNP